MFGRVCMCFGFLALLNHHRGFAEDWVPGNRQVLLEMLQAKDTQFDNLSVELMQIEDRQLNPLQIWAEESDHALKGNQPAPPPPDFNGDLSSRTYEVMKQITLTVRGASTTIQEKDLTDRQGKPVESDSETKTTNAKGVQESMTATGNVRVYHDDPRPFDPIGLLAETRMLDEFCLGVGFGKRIKSIDQIEKLNDQMQVDVTLQLWDADVTKARLLIDRDFLVRRAELLADSRGDETQFIITTEGKVTTGGVLIAAKGHLRREAVAALVKGEKKLLNHRLDDDHRVEVLKLTANLSDSVFQSLATVDRDSATHVVSMVPKPPADRESLEPAQRNYWLLLANALLVLLLGMYLIWQRVRSH